MRQNAAKALLAKGQLALGTMCTTASPLMAEALGHMGYDFLIVDLQHGENNLGNLQVMLQAVSATPAIPIVRVPANSPLYLQRALDLGAYGLIVPMVNSRDDAAAIVESVRYAPAGKRSWGPVRGALYGGSDYFSRSHEELLTVAMIETADGLRNAREILATPGIDACFIGPNDLSISLGFSSEQSEFPAEVEGAVAQIFAAAATTGKASGMQVYSANQAQQRIDQGVRFVSLQSDLRMARAAAGEALRNLRP